MSETGSETDDEIEVDTRTRRGGTPLRVAAVALLVLAVLFTGFAGVRLLGTDDVRSADATARDEALRAARSGVAAFNTFDYRNVAGVMDGWLAISTGTLREQVEADKATQAEKLAAGRTITTAEVADAAITDLDADRGTATVIASVVTTVTPDGGAPVAKRQRYQTTLTRTDQGWLLSGIGVVAVQSV